jgi:DNA-binding response OmpR family regulator
MSVLTVRLLHVEDDAMQQRMIAHHLKALPEFAFTITAVTSEQRAMEYFQKAGCDLVLLDYQLAEGDGLHTLGRMREVDPIVPIIAISGVATSQVAAQLVQAGADDYFDKRELSSSGLAKSIRASLRRAEAVRKTIASRMPDEPSRAATKLTELCVDYVRRIGVGFLEQLDVITQDLKHAGMSAQELEQMHENATLGLEVPAGLDRGRMKLLTRPLLLELLVRVYDDPNLSAERRDHGDHLNR